MAKMKNCKSCGKEVASSAKVCPHCGQKLKMGMMAKLGILVVILIGAAIAGMPTLNGPRIRFSTSATLAGQ